MYIYEIYIYNSPFIYTHGCYDVNCFNDDIVKYFLKCEFYCQSLHIVHELIIQTKNKQNNKLIERI